MDDSSPSVNITPELIEYGVQKFLKLFGKDYESVELAKWFKGLQGTALTQTATVHCLGMLNPLPFSQIYQPTRLLVGPDLDDTLPRNSALVWTDRVSRSMLQGRAFNAKLIEIHDFLRRDQDALIFGGPGWGKTTFLHHVFRSTVANDDTLPVLVTLRRPSALDDLERFVNVCARIQKKQHRACTLLLVDGYDEVDSASRKRVSEALLKFQALRAGKFYLTCRDYYQVSGIKAPEVHLDAFTRDDQLRFVQVFLTAFGVFRDDPEVVVSQLEERGFKEFLSHPLLLTLACIVRTGSTNAQPRSALRLIERALEVLCFQWDEQKQIGRQRSTPLDGNDRMRILKHVAYRSKSPFVKGYRAEEIAKRQLVLLALDRVDPRETLVEIARFYGILVPAEDGYEFVHRTIHDYLAAKQWVESGEFARVTAYEWNARTGYAACFVEDATDILKKALFDPDGLPAVTEIIGNFASFDAKPMADALITYFSANGRVLQYHRGSLEVTAGKYAPRISGQLESDFLRLANSQFLDFIVEYCCSRNSRVPDLLVAYAVTELHARRVKLMHETYRKAVAAYKTERFAFDVPGAKPAQLQFLNPVLQNRIQSYKGPQHRADDARASDAD
jgi:hypothetical protein